MKKVAAMIALLLLAAGAAGCQPRERRPQEESASSVSREEQRPSQADEPVPPPEESEEEEEPEEPDAGEVVAAVEEMLAALQSGDREQIKAHIDYTNLLQLQEGQPDVNHLAILRQLQYTVGEATVNGATASVTVELTNLDMKVVLGSYFKAAGELEFSNALSDDPRSEAELETEYIQLFRDTLEANRANTAQRTVDITLLQAGGRWKAQVSEALRNAVLGDYFIAQGQVGIGAGEE